MATNDGDSNDSAPAPARKQGLYDPRAGARRLRRRLHREREGRGEPPDRRRLGGLAAPHGPPGRVRLRGEHGRRRRHHDRPCRTASCKRGGARRTWASSCPRRAGSPWATSSCRRTKRKRPRARRRSRRIVGEAGQRLVGWRPVPVDEELADIGPTAEAGRAGDRAARHRGGRRLRFVRGRGLRADRLPDPQAGEQPACAATSRSPRRSCSTSARSARRSSSTRACSPPSSSTSTTPT